MHKALIVIPARWASSRFPGKPLAKIKGISMLERVWKIANLVEDTKTIVATDNKEIYSFCKSIGAECIMTSENCKTGSDRVREAVNLLSSNEEIIFSFQGDAVLLPPWVVSEIIEEMQNDKSVKICTPAVELSGSILNEFIKKKNMGSSTGTTVTFNSQRDALYFSKSLIPYSRSGVSPVYRHIGLYGYRKEALEKFSKLPESKFEKIEQLEQLRILEAGEKIRVIITDLKGRTLLSVDNPDDILEVERIIEAEGEICQ